MKYCLLYILKLLLNFVYFFFKLLPVRNKITLISRQSDRPPLDFLLIREELKNSGFKIVISAKPIVPDLFGYVSFAFCTILQCFHIATSKGVIIDSYCIPVSVLCHRKSLKIFQIWHAMGSLKRFGFSIIDENEGRNKELSTVMNMHQNYSYVFCSSEASKPHIAEAFSVPLEKMVVNPLPRADYIVNRANINDIKTKFFGLYPFLDNGKKIVLYAPTFRKSGSVPFKKTVEKCNLDEYNLIIKFHGGAEEIYTKSGSETKAASESSGFSGLQLAMISDSIITDYSALIYEVMLMDKPIYLYTADIDSYNANRGFYLDYHEIPLPKFSKIEDIYQLIGSAEFNTQMYKPFINKYVEFSDNATGRLCNFIMGKITANGSETE